MSNSVHQNIQLILNEFTQNLQGSSAAFCFLDSDEDNKIISSGDNNLVSAASTLKIADAMLLYSKHKSILNNSVSWNELRKKTWSGQNISDIFEGSIKIKDIINVIIC